MYGFEGGGFVGILWYLRRLSNIHINHNLYMVIKKKKLCLAFGSESLSLFLYLEVINNCVFGLL